MVADESIRFLSIETLSQSILEILPQTAPFRYLDRIVELDENHIVGEYRFKEDEFFYKGHFPGRPTTPGVILIEAMAQTSVVAFGIYLFAIEQGFQAATKHVSLFTDVEAEFMKEVPPGTRVVIKAEKIFWRRKKLRAKASLYLEDGTLAATASLSGMGVER